MKRLFSDNISNMGLALPRIINQHRSSADLNYAKTAQDYYDYKHDILNHRIFYVDDNGMLKEDKHASNVRIPHPFFTEIVDQGVQYLLSNNLEVTVEDDAFRELLMPYINERFQRVLQEVLEGSSIKGNEYLFARTNATDTLEFQISNSLSTIRLVYKDEVRIVRYWDERTMLESGKITKVTVAEVWTDKQVYFLKQQKYGKSFIANDAYDLNPRAHVIAYGKEQELLERSYGTIPFFELKNNKNSLSDLAPIKALIDDYDLMAAFLSNNLQDFVDAIYIVKGYQGDDLSQLRHNIKSKKVVRTGDQGGVDIRTIDIPVEARSKKLEIDKEAIYKFGMALDSTQVGDGNITNVVIRSRYALLDMKANKKEVRLNELIRWCLDMIVDDINRKHSKAFDSNDISFELVRESVIDSKELADIEHTEAQTRVLVIQSILAAASRIDEESTLRLICEQFDLDYEDVLAQVENEQYKRFNLPPTDEGVNDDGEEPS